MISKILHPITLTGTSYDERVNSLLAEIKNAPNGSLVLAGELCLSGYELVVDDDLIAKISSVAEDRVVGFSRIVKSREIYNEFALVSKDGIIYRQGKHKLFLPNNEHKFFNAVADNIKVFELNGIKIAVLICFELRFLDLWQRLKEAQIILVPAMWGSARGDVYTTLCRALAVSNFCYVIASSDLDFKYKAVFKPNGEICESCDFDSTFGAKVKRSLAIL